MAVGIVVMSISFETKTRKQKRCSLLIVFRMPASILLTLTSKIAK